MILECYESRKGFGILTSNGKHSNDLVKAIQKSQGDNFLR